MSCRIAAFELVTLDVERLAAFYCRGLGFAREGDVLRLGSQSVRLVRAGADARPYPPDSTAADLWFQHFAIVTTDIAKAAASALAAGAAAISQGGPQHLPRRSGGVTAWKFRDPEGHPLELLQFPPGAVPPAWADRRGLHLGIDHTAISVTDAEASIAWYRDRFGFSVAARELNWGVEQERLDGVVGARAEVVALRPADEPPHLELLAYKPPGRPSAARAGDVAATCTVLVNGGGNGGGNGRGGLTVDPDGHRVRD